MPFDANMRSTTVEHELAFESEVKGVRVAFTKSQLVAILNIRGHGWS